MQFVLVIVEHRTLGLILSPYLIKPERNPEVYSVYDKITFQKLTAYEQILSPEEVQLVRYIENYNDQNLHKLFCKKKQSSFDFVNTMKEDMLSNHVRPYIEKQMAKCLDVLQYNPVAIFHKTLQNTLYESDRLMLIDKECSTVFNFRRTESGIAYKLTIEHAGKTVNLNGKQGVVLINEPCCLAVEDKLFVFRDIDSKKLIPFFEKDFIGIAKQTEKKYFETFVKNAVGNYKVKAEGFEIVDNEELPKAVISLENNLNAQLSLVLKFIYGGNSIYYANRHTGMKVSFSMHDDKAVFTRTMRDYEFENSCIAKLLSFGLLNKEGPYFEPISGKKSPEEVYGPVTWLNFNRALLVKNGFEVTQAKLDKEYYLGNFELKFEVSEKSNDWFDIHATIEFDGFRIPFSEFKEYIVNGIREYVLPNNRVMILPEEWFESYSDLINFSTIDGEFFKLKKQHFSILNSRVGGLSENFRNNLRSLLSTDKLLQEPVPQGIQAELRQYQDEGYNWMFRLYKNGFGGCLADDMGLGKTLQTLTLLKRISSESTTESQKTAKKNEKQTVQLSIFDSAVPAIENKSSGCSVVIVPTSLVHNWLNECRKFVPSLSVKTYIGPQRGKLNDCMPETDLIITSYGILRNDLEQFIAQRFTYIILDESQMIKNPGSKTYAAVVQLRTESRMVLSGTPIENSLADLWAQFNFINPGLLGNLNFFQSEFQWPIERNNDENRRQRLQQLISPFLLRRTKSQVAKELPELVEQVLFCDLNEVQESYYEREKSKARKLVLENINRYGFRNVSMQILKSLMRLRQIACHPLLLDEEFIAGSGKFDEIVRNLETLNQEGHKALLFSSFVGHLELVADWLNKKEIGYVMLTGETRKREEVVEKFQTDDSVRFFLISLKAGGTGLNLTAASYVLMLDPWWNPAAEKQAINRAHRIGQDKNVMVYRFIARNTLEEKIIRLQERKSELADIFVNENVMGKISEKEIMELFE